MNTAEAELLRRRKRASSAQSAFRKRQKQALRDKDAEIARLKQGLWTILNETRTHDRPELRTRIFEAAALAGMQSDPRMLIRGFTSASTGPPPPQLVGEAESGDSGILMHNYNRSISLGSMMAPSEACDLQGLRETSSSRMPNNAGQLPVSSRSWGQHFNTSDSIRPDPFQCYKCKEGASVILPFLGAGAFTLAGRLFWHLVEKHDAAVHSPNKITLEIESVELSSNGLQNDGLRLPPQNLISKSPPLQALDLTSWVTDIEARLDYHMPNSTTAAGSWSSNSRHRDQRASSVHEMFDPESRRRSGYNWLSPEEVEQRMRVAVGDAVFAVLAAPVLNRWERKKRAHTVEDSTEALDGFLDMLSENFVCFGDGPRWSMAVFDILLRNWCHAIAGA